MASFGRVSISQKILEKDQEFQDLCEAITENISSITHTAKNLHGALNIFGTPEDTRKFRSQISVWQTDTNELIKSTSVQVGNLARLSRTANKPQKLQADKITGHFKDVVDNFTSTQMAVSSKMRQSLPKQPYTEEPTEPLEAELQQQTQLEIETEMLEEQERRILEVEAEIKGVQELMVELGVLVSEQKTAVDIIEEKVNEAKDNVNKGAVDLALAEMKSNRRKIFIFVILLIVVGIIIGIIIWYSLPGYASPEANAMGQPTEPPLVMSSSASTST